MRKKIVAGNWKMNVDLSESINLIESINKIYDHNPDVEVCIAPSFPFLKESSESVSYTHLTLPTICSV